MVGAVARPRPARCTELGLAGRNVSGIATMVIRVLAFLAIWVRGTAAGWLAAFCASEGPHVTPTSCSFLE